MPLRGRVGRHSHAGGRQCQNWSDDQTTVITLLNRIPVSDGGAGGSLTGRIVAGLSSDALYRAIVQFEDRHFPRQRSGFVDPGGPMLMRLEQLAALGNRARPADDGTRARPSHDAKRARPADSSSTDTG